MQIKVIGELVNTVQPDDGQQYAVESELLQAIRDAPENEEIEVVIDSLGGSLSAGMSIYRALKNHPGKVIAKVEGYACSAASMIMCAADEVEVYANSIVMIHGVQLIEQTVNASNIEELAKEINSVDDAVASIYIGRTGQSDETIRDWMNPGKWMSGKEAVALGFADLIRAENQADPDKLRAKANLIDGKELKALMKDIEKLANEADETKPTDQPGEEEKKPDDSKKDEANPDSKKEKEMDEEQASCKKKKCEEEDTMKNAADILTAERKRLQEIDAIADMVADKNLLNEAKYGDHPMTAQELSFKVLQQAKADGKNFLNAWNQDVNDSHVNEVGSLPSDIEGKDQKAQAAGKSLLHEAAKLVNTERGKK